MLEFALVILINRRAALKSKSDEMKDKKNDTSRMIETKVRPAFENVKKEKKQTEWAIPSTHTIDFVSFCLHFSGFLIFNAIYWCQNL